MSNAGNSRDRSPFGIHSDERVAIFIEGSNFYAAARMSNLMVDYRRLLNHFEDNSVFKRAYYYTAVLPEEQEYNSIKPLLDYLEYNGFTLVTKPIKEFTDSSGRRKVKGNLDVEIAIDMLNATEWCDHIVLFSGDSDFTALVREAQRKGIKLTVVSSMEMASDELRRAADAFVSIDNIRAIVERVGDDGRPVSFPRGDGNGTTMRTAPGGVADNGERPGVAPRPTIRRPVGIDR